MPPFLAQTEPWSWFDFKGHEMSRALALAAVAFLLTMLLGNRLIPLLRRSRSASRSATTARPPT
jgi:hypothetical protein